MGRIAPYIAACICLRDQAGQLGPVVTGRVRHRPGADQAVTTIDADMVLVAEGGHRQVDARRTVVGRFGLRPLHGPAGVPVLLRELGRLVRPPGWDAPLFDVALLGIRVALLRGGDDARAGPSGWHASAPRGTSRSCS